MLHQKKIWVLTGMVAFIVISMAATKAPYDKDRNLKVLPKDISDEKLDSIMKSYNVALGVTCNFCHVPMKNIADSLDYASDADPMKKNALDMMKMTININKTMFYFDKNERPEYLHTVTCKTCHRGEAFPGD